MRSTLLLAQEEEKKEFLVVLPCTHVTDQWFECVAVKFLYYLPPSPLFINCLFSTLLACKLGHDTQEKKEPTPKTDLHCSFASWIYD